MLRGSRWLGRVRRPRGTAGRRPIALPATEPGGDSGERPVGPRARARQWGQRAGFSPCTRDPPGCTPATPRDSRPCPCPGGVGSVWPAGGIWGGVPACTMRTLPEEPAQGVSRFGSHAREPAEGLRPGNLPRAWDLLIPSLLPAPRHPIPGSRGPRVGSQLRRGHSETSPSAISDADRAQPSPHAGAALLCLTSAKPFRTNSCCPNSDEPPV